MLVDGVIGEFRVTRLANRVPGVLEAAATRRNHGRRPIGAFNKVARVFDGGRNHLVADKRVAAPRRDGRRAVGGNAVQRAAPVAEMAVAAITCRVVFDDVAGEHHLLVRNERDDVARRVRASEEHQLDPAFAEIDRHPVSEGHGRPGEARNALMTFEKARKARELAVPIFLPAFMDHRLAGLRGDDFRGVIGRCAKNPHRVVMRQHDMLDRLVGHATDLFHNLVGKARRRLRVDDHDAFIADNDAGIRVALGREGPQVAPDLGKADRLFAEVALRCEALSHDTVPLSGRYARKCWHRRHCAFRFRPGRRTA